MPVAKLFSGRTRFWRETAKFSDAFATGFPVAKVVADSPNNFKRPAPFSSHRTLSYPPPSPFLCHFLFRSRLLSLLSVISSPTLLSPFPLTAFPLSLSISHGLFSISQWCISFLPLHFSRFSARRLGNFLIPICFLYSYDKM